MSRPSGIAFSLVAASLVLFGWGCNPFQSAQDKIAEKVAEGMIENATGADVDLEEGSVTVTDVESGMTASYGENVKLPDDFPSDVPMYPDATLTGVTFSRNDGVSGWVTMTSSDDVSKLVAWYADEAKGKGWESDASMTVNGAEYRSWTKDAATMTVNVTKAEDSDEVGIMVTYSKEADDSSDSSEE
ncbi:hypothetical protein KJ925_04660 [Patescibacteria group bacterium]|nr:hypothetical protein [Patescibacteria group bacterium]